MFDQKYFSIELKALTIIIVILFGIIIIPSDVIPRNMLSKWRVLIGFFFCYFACFMCAWFHHFVDVWRPKQMYGLLNLAFLLSAILTFVRTSRTSERHGMGENTDKCNSTVHQTWVERFMHSFQIPNEILLRSHSNEKQQQQHQCAIS